MILSGDHIYRMDYEEMIESHKASGADVTIACMEVPIEEGRAFGVVVINEDQQIIAFEEKPEQPTPIPSNPKKRWSPKNPNLISSQPVDIQWKNYLLVQGWLGVTERDRNVNFVSKTAAGSRPAVDQRAWNLKMKCVTVPSLSEGTVGF